MKTIYLEDTKVNDKQEKQWEMLQAKKQTFPCLPVTQSAHAHTQKKTLVHTANKKSLKLTAILPVQLISNTNTDNSYAHNPLN